MVNLNNAGERGESFFLGTRQEQRGLGHGTVFSQGSGQWLDGFGTVLAAIPAALVAADGAVKSSSPGARRPIPNATTVDLFDGIASGEIARQVLFRRTPARRGY